MDQLRQVLANIQRTLSGLTATQKLLIGSLVVVMVMALFMVALFTGRPQMVELLPNASPGDQQRAATLLDSRGFPYRVGPGGMVLVPMDQRVVALGQLGEEGYLPADTSILFNNLTDRTPWTMSREQARQQEVYALQNELNLVIGQFRGVRRASVIIDAPPASGLGMGVRLPTASVTVFTSTGRPIDQNTVDAVAHLVASARAGLDVDNVRVIDGSNNRQHRARSDDVAMASSYLEHASKVEDRTRERLLGMLTYIHGVVVAVNAQVDIRRTDSVTTRVLEPGRGTVTAPSREMTSERVMGGADVGAEPGVRPNVGMDITRAGGGGTRSTETRTDAELITEFGKETMRISDPRGMPIKINATNNIPRSYYVARWTRETGAAAPDPTEDEILELVRSEVDRIRADVQPQVDASAGENGEAGEVVVSMIPDPNWLFGGASGAQLAGVAGLPGLGSDGGGVLREALGSGAIKTVALGGLALAAIGMMLLMVRKASRSGAVPTAEEIVGIPPALSRASDLVGEADEEDNALAGIELTDESMKSRRLMEQVRELVAEKPEDAAVLINRWITTED